jgi:hypothetical protein
MFANLNLNFFHTLIVGSKRIHVFRSTAKNKLIIIFYYYIITKITINGLINNRKQSKVYNFFLFILLTIKLRINKRALALNWCISAVTFITCYFLEKPYDCLRLKLQKITSNQKPYLMISSFFYNQNAWL